MNNFLSSFPIYLCYFFLFGSGFFSLSSTFAGSPVSHILQDSNKVVKIPVDMESSWISWKGTEMWKSGIHEGTVNLKEGFLLSTNNQITGGKFIADMKSIAITDIPKHEPVPRKRLRNHLKSEDFFYVEEYPTAKFEITKTQVLENDSLRVWGNLSIRDVTKTISFIAIQKTNNQARLEFQTTFVIDRFKWNIAYQGSFWDRISSILDNNFVDAEIQLSVRLVANLED